MLNRTLMAVILALCATWSLAAPVVTAADQMKTGAQQRGRSRRALALQNARYGVDLVDCDGVAEPRVPTAVPSWAAGRDLSRDRSVQELGRSGAFLRGSEIVIKRCTPDALDAAVERVRPAARRGVDNPTFDIFFDCGSDFYRIYVNGELEFGTGDSATRGTFRLLAPGFNVELNGSFRHRIIRVNKFARLTVFGLRFQHGSRINDSWQIGRVPSGAWNGGAILASFSASVVAYKCRFERNTARSRYVRWGSGGAIMAETDSDLLVWDCAFRFNHGTNGGAIAAASARVVNIIRSSFNGNVGHGGYDGTKKIQVNGKTLSVVTIRSGAVRVDSVTGYRSSDEHVMICNSHFRRNRIEFTRGELAEFGYAESEVEYLRAGAAVVSVWNSEGNLDLRNGDRNLLTVKGCVFDRNYENLPWSGFRMGMFVLEAEGAGSIELSDINFSRNSVQDATCRLDNSDLFGEAFDMTLRNIEISDNNGVREFRFNARNRRSSCYISDVEGLRNGRGNCWNFI